MYAVYLMYLMLFVILFDRWGCSASKSLTLDQMMKIMLDIKNLKDWRLALKHVPPRKLRKEGDLISTNPKLEYW